MLPCQARVWWRCAHKWKWVTISQLRLCLRPTRLKMFRAGGRRIDRAGIKVISKGNDKGSRSEIKNYFQLSRYWFHRINSFDQTNLVWHKVRQARHFKSAFAKANTGFIGVKDYAVWLVKLKCWSSIRRSYVNVNITVYVFSLAALQCRQSPDPWLVAEISGKSTIVAAGWYYEVETISLEFN